MLVVGSNKLGTAQNFRETSKEKMSLHRKGKISFVLHLPIQGGSKQYTRKFLNKETLRSIPYLNWASTHKSLLRPLKRAIRFHNKFSSSYIFPPLTKQLDILTIFEIYNYRFVALSFNLFIISNPNLYPHYLT